jgi:CubicO group peptidase (beta-lactamase class C family)
MGAEHDAEVTCDGLGAAIHDGGICATARDLARFGMLLLDGGLAGDRPVIPAAWLREAWAVDADLRNAFARSDNEPFFPGGWYHDQFWFVPRPPGDVLLGLGIYGQMVYVNPATATVAAKLSSWPYPQSALFMEDTLRAFDTVSAALATPGSGAAWGRVSPVGVAAGLSRNRSGSDA